MALQILSSLVAPQNSPCLSKTCDKPNFDNLTATKCNHIFCKACLARWFETPRENKITLCPNCRDDKKPISKDECASLVDCIERFTYYARYELLTLKEKLTLEKVNKIESCHLKKEAKTHRKKTNLNDETDECSICTVVAFTQLYFIIKDKDPDKVGRFMHDGCWQTAVAPESLLLDLSLHEMVKVAQQLPWPPKKRPQEPQKPASPVKVAFFLLVLPVSIWAWITNLRLYSNRNPALFVLSLPVLLILTVLSLILSGIKRVFTERPY